MPLLRARWISSRTKSLTTKLTDQTTQMLSGMRVAICNHVAPPAADLAFRVPPDRQPGRLQLVADRPNSFAIVVGVADEHVDVVCVWHGSSSNEAVIFSTTITRGARNPSSASALAHALLNRCSLNPQLAELMVDAGPVAGQPHPSLYRFRGGTKLRTDFSQLILRSTFQARPPRREHRTRPAL
jgi:hypothetical protein